MFYLHRVPIADRSGGIAIIGVECDGTERNITDCNFREPTTADVGAQNGIYVFIVCRPGVFDVDYSGIV